MEENIKLENEINNDENHSENERNSINNPPPPSNNNNESNNPENNSQINNENHLNENEIKNNNIRINEELEKKLDNSNLINNNIDNSNIDININNNINNIKEKNNLQFPLKSSFNFNFDKNLSKEEKLEQIENNLHSLLSELSNLKKQGNDFFNNKNYEAAEQQYREGIKKINEFLILSNIDEVNGQIQESIVNINIFNLQFYNNLSSALFKQGKFEESLKNSEFIIQNLEHEHVVSYCRILFCLIELKKIISANHYAEIIRKKFGNNECFSKFKDQLARLEIINKEFSNKILNQNPELKKELISLNDNEQNKNEIKKEQNNLKKYIPYLVGGAVILFAGGRYLYKKYKNK